jgi:hypothetical protein
VTPERLAGSPITLATPIRLIDAVMPTFKISCDLTPDLPIPTAIVTPSSRPKSYSTIKKSQRLKPRIKPTTPDRTNTPAARTAAVRTQGNSNRMMTVRRQCRIPQATKRVPLLHRKQSNGRHILPTPTQGLAVEPNLVHTHTISQD